MRHARFADSSTKYINLIIQKRHLIFPLGTNAIPLAKFLERRYRGQEGPTRSLTAAVLFIRLVSPEGEGSNPVYRESQWPKGNEDERARKENDSRFRSRLKLISYRINIDAIYSTTNRNSKRTSRKYSNLFVLRIYSIRI